MNVFCKYCGRSIDDGKKHIDFEIDDYTSRIEWTEILDEDSEVPESGLYFFNCRGDNHTFYELHQLIKGEKLCKHYLDHYFDGWAVVKPIQYHFVEKEEKEFVLQIENQKYAMPSHKLS